MLNTDKYGILSGLALSARDLLVPRITAGKNIRWGFFIPSGDGFKFIDELVKDGKVIPVLLFTILLLNCFVSDYANCT